jgi:hypothetical protein
MPHTDPCLGPSGVGMLDLQGNLTQAARDAFTTQVILLLTSGNANGKGAKISSLLGIPFPPPSGVKVLDPDKLLTDPTDPLADLFWFAPSPFAPLTFDTLRDPNGAYQKQIITNLYQPLIKAMSLKGNAIAPPILDYSGFLPPDISIDLTLPDLPKIAAVVPNVLALQALGIDLGDIPSFVANLAAVIPSPSIPEIPTPPIPQYEFVIFSKLFSGILALPFKLLPELITKFSPPSLLAPSPPELFNLILGLFFGLFLDLLKTLGLVLILPKLLIATCIVLIQNTVAAMAPMVVSQIIGTGLVVKTIGQALGLA